MLGYWTIGPAVVVVFAMLALLVGRTGATWPEALSAQPGSSGELHTLRTVVFVGVPLVAIIGISLLLRKIWNEHPQRDRKAPPPEFDDQDVAAVTIVGDIATAAVVVVAGLGLLRAFAPVLILRGQLVQVDIVWVWVCVGTGLILIGLPWLIMIVTTALRVPQALKDRVLESGPHRRIADDPLGSCSSVSSVCFLMLAARLGLAATAVLGIGSLTGIVSAMGLTCGRTPLPRRSGCWASNAHLWSRCWP